LMGDTAFAGGLRCRWESVRQTSLSLTRVNQLIDSVTNLLSEAQPRQHSRWPILGQYVWPNPDPIPSSYAGEISALKSWISSRLQWIDQNLPNAGACSDWAYTYPGTIHMTSYPNPFTGGGTLYVESKASQTVDIEAVDMVGRRISTQKVNLTAGKNTVPLQAQSWPRGVYMVRMSNRNGEKQSLKLVKE
jgi:hypothetical protein